METINEVVINKNCTGCGACLSVCNKDAISINKTTMGRLYAHIDYSKCVQCGLCSKVCPNTQYGSSNLLKNIQSPLQGNILNVYTGHSNNELIYRNSQSGGIVTQILYNLFEQSLIDAAILCHTAYSKHSSNEPIIITKKEDLYKTQKSFYSPVSILSQLKKSINYSSVAIVGLPCQIEALTLINKRNKYTNIKYKIGLICDRCITEISNDIVLKYCKVSNKNNRIIAKGKSYSSHPNAYKYAPMIVDIQDEKPIIISNQLRLQLKDYLTPPRCRICYDKLNIFADITCGDPWGMSNIDWEKGDSVIATRTPLGEQIINNLRKEKKIFIQKAELSELIKGQKIEDRIDQITSACAIYHNLKLELPPFINFLPISKVPKNQNDDSLIETSIKRFLNYEKLPTQKIIKKIYINVRVKLCIKLFKNKIRQIYHKFFI